MAARKIEDRSWVDQVIEHYRLVESTVSEETRVDSGCIEVEVALGYWTASGHFD